MDNRGCAPVPLGAQVIRGTSPSVHQPPQSSMRKAKCLKYHETNFTFPCNKSFFQTYRKSYFYSLGQLRIRKSGSVLIFFKMRTLIVVERETRGGDGTVCCLAELKIVEPLLCICLFVTSPSRTEGWEFEQERISELYIQIIHDYLFCSKLYRATPLKQIERGSLTKD